MSTETFVLNFIQALAMSVAHNKDASDEVLMLARVVWFSCWRVSEPTRPWGKA